MVTGQDRTDTIDYFGSPDSRLIAKDFNAEQRRDVTIRKEVLWESPTATLSKIVRMEMHFIRELRSNDPAIGYNRWPPPGKAASHPDH